MQCDHSSVVTKKLKNEKSQKNEKGQKYEKSQENEKSQKNEISQKKKKLSHWKKTDSKYFYCTTPVRKWTFA